ncbi:MAG: prepilin-type N-terminal cleavage/methylation domain-containing protein [Microgenomates group bacterium]
MKKGFSLVELMIAVTIIGIMLSLGISAYARGRDRQSGRSAGEQIISFLSQNQKKADIGDEDCTGKYLGQSLTISLTTSITAESVCTGGSGSVENITISGITSMTGGTILFKPLSGGATVSVDPLNIDYTTTSGSVFRVQVTSSGTIDYKGVQP